MFDIILVDFREWTSLGRGTITLKYDLLEWNSNSLVPFYDSNVLEGFEKALTLILEQMSFTATLASEEISLDEEICTTEIATLSLVTATSANNAMIGFTEDHFHFTDISYLPLKFFDK